MKRTFLVGAALLWMAGCGSSGEILSSQESDPLSKKDPPAPVDASRELLIIDPSVVDDPVRTTYSPKPKKHSDGVWSFGRLIENMVDRQDPSELVLSILAQWEVDQSIGGAIAPARPSIRSFLIDPWRLASGCAAGAGPCQLDFTKAPVRLTAIVNRIDKRPLPDDNDPDDKLDYAGEGRFVFDVLSSTGAPANFTIILEYYLPAKKSEDILKWAERWHKLGTLSFGEDFNDELEKITDDFAGKHAGGDRRSNKSALRFFRTNEVSLAIAGSDPSNTPSTKLWELRSVELNRDGWLAPITVAQTPPLSSRDSPELASFLNANAAAILGGAYALPNEMLDAAAPVPKDFVWSATGTSDPNVVRAFALGTCSGCHRNETGTSFLHLGKREVGAPVVVSTWLATVELPRRAADLNDLLAMSKHELKDLYKNRHRDKPGHAH